MSDRKIIIAGNEFTIPQPFEAGHVCTEGEARALNQLLAENVRNNMAAKVKAGTAAAADVTKYAAEYVFSTASVPQAKLDPVENECRKLARAAIKTELAKQNIKIDQVDEGALAEEILRVAAMPEIRKVAEGIVNARKKSANIQLGSLGIGGAAPAAAAE